MAVSHLALDFRPRHERRDRIHHHQVDGPRAHEGIDDVQCLLTRVGLRHEELVRLDADRARVCHVERVFGVDECADATRALRLRDGVE